MSKLGFVVGMVCSQIWTAAGIITPNPERVFCILFSFVWIGFALLMLRRAKQNV